MKNVSASRANNVVVVLIGVLVIAIASFALFRSQFEHASSPAAATTPTSAANPAPYPFASPTPVPTLPFHVVPTVNLLTPLFPSPVPLATYTATPFRSPTPTSSPTPVQPITAWLAYTNTTHGYAVAYPNTWYLEVSDASNVFITSYQPPYFRGSGAVKIDVLVGTQTYSETLAAQKPLCIDGVCGFRVDDRGPFTSPASGGINRVIGLRFQIGSKHYIFSAAIQDPPADASRNAAIVEQIVSSFHFVR